MLTNRVRLVLCISADRFPVLQSDFHCPCIHRKWMADKGHCPCHNTNFRNGLDRDPMNVAGCKHLNKTKLDLLLLLFIHFRGVQVMQAICGLTKGVKKFVFMRDWQKDLKRRLWTRLLKKYLVLMALHRFVHSARQSQIDYYFRHSLHSWTAHIDLFLHYRSNLHVWLGNGPQMAAGSTCLDSIRQYSLAQHNRNRKRQISKAPLKSQAQGTSLFTSAASNQRAFPKNGPWEAQVWLPYRERMRQIRRVFQRVVRGKLRSGCHMVRGCVKSEGFSKE